LLSWNSAALPLFGPVAAALGPGDSVKLIEVFESKLLFLEENQVSNCEDSKEDRRSSMASMRLMVMMGLLSFVVFVAFSLSIKSRVESDIILTWVFIARENRSWERSSIINVVAFASHSSRSAPSATAKLVTRILIERSILAIIIHNSSQSIEQLLA